MELLLIRHAKPVIVSHAPEGADPELSHTGVDQAEHLARVLRDGVFGPVEAIASSTMRRAHQTAQPTADALDLPIALDERLVELDHGSPRYGDGFAGFPTRAAAFDSINEGLWDGHRFDPTAFSERVVGGIEAAIDQHRDHASLAVFCHGGVISAFIAHLVGAGRPLFMAVDYTSITRVRVDDDGYRELLSVNERPRA